MNNEWDDLSLFARIIIGLAVIFCGVGATLTVVHLATETGIQNQAYSNRQNLLSTQEQMRNKIGAIEKLQLKIKSYQAKIQIETDEAKKVTLSNQIIDWEAGIATFQTELEAQITTAKSANVILPDDISSYKTKLGLK